MIDMHQSGPNTRKVFHKLLTSFHMQKKLLGAYKVTKSLIKEVFLLLLLLGGGGWCWEGLQSDLENWWLPSPHIKLSNHAYPQIKGIETLWDRHYLTSMLLKETVVHVRETKILKHHISSKRQRWLWLRKKLVLIYYWQINISYCHFS